MPGELVKRKQRSSLSLGGRGLTVTLLLFRVVAKDIAEGLFGLETKSFGE